MKMIIIIGLLFIYFVVIAIIDRVSKDRDNFYLEVFKKDVKENKDVQ